MEGTVHVERGNPRTKPSTLGPTWRTVDLDSRRDVQCELLHEATVRHPPALGDAPSTPQPAKHRTTKPDPKLDRLSPSPTLLRLLPRLRSTLDFGVKSPGRKEGHEKGKGKRLHQDFTNSVLSQLFQVDGKMVNTHTSVILYICMLFIKLDYYLAYAVWWTNSIKRCGSWEQP